MTIFKKPFRVSQSSDLKSSAKRKLQQTLKDTFKSIDSNSEVWDVLFPVKQSVTLSADSSPIPVQVQTMKIELGGEHSNEQPVVEDKKQQPKKLSQQNYNYNAKQKSAPPPKAISHQKRNLNVLTVNNLPHFIEIEDQTFLPTLFALHMVPNLLKPIVVHSNISTFIMSGADLMLPGLSLSSQPEFEEGELCSLFVSGNPYPFAVGRMTFTHKRMTKKPNDGKGKAMIILHLFNDFMWQYGVSHDLTVPVPEGFCADIIQPMAVRPNDTEGDDRDESEEQENNEDQEQESESAEQEADNDTSKSQSEEQISEADMDQRLVYWFMETVKNHVKDDELPMDTSAIYSRMLTAVDKREYVDVKKSSFKKLSKFMKHVTLKKYIGTKQAGATIVSINRSHPDYVKHKDPAAMGKGSASKPATVQLKRKVQTTSLYKPIAPLKPIFETTSDESASGHYRESDVKAVLIKYVERNKLKAGTTNFPVKLDELLYNQLFHSKKAEVQHNLGSVVPIQLLLAKLLEKMTSYLAVEFQIPNSNNPEEMEVYTVLQKGATKGIYIDVDKLMGTKAGTRINGLAPYLNYSPPPKANPIPLECPQFNEFIQRLKTKVSTGIKVNTNLPANHDNKKDPEVFMQGNNAKIVQDLLVNEYGIPVSLIHVTDNTKKKKKSK